MIILSKSSILFCTTEFPPEPGGIGNHAYGLVDQLQLNFKVTVLTENRGAKSEFQKFSSRYLNGCQVIGISRNFISLVTYIERLYQYFKFRNKNDIQFFSGKFYIWISMLVPNKTNSIVIVHGSEIKQRGILKYFFKSGLLRSKYIVCVSNYTRKKLLEHYGESIQSKIVIINNGFIGLNNYVERRNLNFDNINLLTIGGVHKRKGQQNVIKALPILQSQFKNIYYQAAGIPVELTYMQNLANSLNISNHINFLGTISEEKKWQLLSNAHLFMMLSEELDNGDFEGFGIAILEAMSIGVPAIGSKTSGIADAIKDRYSGRLVDPNNSNEILEAVQDILTNYIIYSENAISWSRQFRWDIVVNEYVKLMK